MESTPLGILPVPVVKWGSGSGCDCRNIEGCEIIIGSDKWNIEDCKITIGELEPPEPPELLNIEDCDISVS